MTIPTGVLPVLATPFDDSGAIDRGALANEINWVYDQGVSGIVMGMVSEALRLSSEERDELATAMCTVADGRGSVITSVGAESLHTAIRHSKHAEHAGATAVMAIAPVATVCDESELLWYYSGIIESITIPVVVQDASGYLGKPLSIDIQAKLLHEFGDRALFKPEAQPIGPNLSALRDATQGKAQVYEGTGGIALVDSFKRGLAGTMPGPDICWALVELWRALEAGETERVDELNGWIGSLVSIQNSLDSFIAVEKHLLVRQGVLKNVNVRGPVGYRMDNETVAEVERRFDRLRAIVD